MNQSFLPFEHELIVDLFAGGGGASVAMKQALGRDPDIAINHSDKAISVHTANHPGTDHYCEDIFEVDPIKATRGRPVGLLHASPDCTHHSQAKGGQPRDRQIRSLSWVVLKWAGRAKPRCITLENVQQILQWSPLVAKRDKTGRVIKLSGGVAAPGEQVPIDNQFLVPCRKRKGKNWDRFVSALRSMGYVVQWRNLRACDYGAGTSRDRLFMMARRDGLPIVWPKQTHGAKRDLKPYVPAAASIDWSIPCPSIFTRKRPLVDATLRRVAKGVHRYVLDCADPFIVPVTHTGSDRVHGIGDPLRTITAAQRGEFMLSVPTLIQTGYGERPGQDPRVPGIEKPLGTVVAEGIKHQVVTAHLTKFRRGATGSAIDDPVPTITSGGAMKRPAGAAHAMGIVTAFMEQAHEELPGRDARDPLSTIVGKGCTQRVISASLATLRNNMVGTDAREPLRTVAAGAGHHALIEYSLSPEAEEGALRVAAFLIRYYGQGGQHGELTKPLHTLTTKERIALVTVTIKGVPYVIVDIGLRMLTPAELFKAQGFPTNYIFTHGHDGNPISKTVQVRLVGNSVSPPPYSALLRANFAHELKYQQARVA